jgi:hypothetical protein
MLSQHLMVNTDPSPGLRRASGLERADRRVGVALIIGVFSLLIYSTELHFLGNESPATDQRAYFGVGE